MRFATVCSGIGAPEYAWSKKLGWYCAWQSEIEAFPCAVLKHHYPTVPNLGDMTKISDEELDRHGKINLICGGTPCQSFSVAGLRKGLDDPRGNLALVFLSLIERTRPEWVVWENVAGVLSSSGGRDFGSFIGGLAKLGYGFAWRVLDAEYFGVPQMRRRIFVVGYRGAWQAASAVLFERWALQASASVNVETRRRIKTIKSSSLSSTQTGEKTLRARAALRKSFYVDSCVFDAMFLMRKATYGREVTGTLCASRPSAVFFLKKPGVNGKFPGVWQDDGFVRFFTPLECERLQGFPDGYTNIRFNNQSPPNPRNRWRALGNSIAVPVLSWIGSRIEVVDSIKRGKTK